MDLSSLMPKITAPIIDIPKSPIAYSYSDTQFELLKELIEEYESSLDSEHEVGVLLTNFGQSVLLLPSSTHLLSVLALSFFCITIYLYRIFTLHYP